MGLWKKIKGAVKAVAPVALGFIPGAGPALTMAYQAYQQKRESEKAARAQRQAVEQYNAQMAVPPNMDIDTMMDAAHMNARFPQPSAFALPRAPMFSASVQAGRRAKRLVEIARGKGRSLGDRIRLSRNVVKFKRRASQTRLRGRFDRAPALHLRRGPFVGPSERFRLLRGKAAKISGGGRARRVKRKQRARMPQARRSRRLLYRRSRRKAA